MANIIVIRNTYGGTEYLQNALAYVSDNRAYYQGGIGVDPYDPNIAYKQMLFTRQYFDKVGGNPLVHFVIAYNDKITDIEQAANFTEKCAKLLGANFQILYCTHYKDTYCGCLHGHIVANSVSFKNGMMIRTGHAEMQAFCDQVSAITGQKCRFFFENKAVYSGV
ncbi:relaxase/mobilization nuclease domain-containing protein [uncultured Ruminococcus sp.]|uniref:relaxase/mobilization nuclease domain-containing protein n=1 Tax=uncultured Ruminococcus sp. TaxID=165186 RepID=UPI0025FF8CFB|nr:relaxase/mobilization nuclease domain-containing protein [uncultured Ruminococcus sp.]